MRERNFISLMNERERERGIENNDGLGEPCKKRIPSPPSKEEEGRGR